MASEKPDEKQDGLPDRTEPTPGLSKSEMKRRAKAEELAAKKAEKAAKTPVVAKKTGSAAEEKDLDPRQYFEIRSRFIKGLLDNKNPNPYPHKFNVTTYLPDFLQEYKGLKAGEEFKDKRVTLGARIYTIRTSGSKLVFYQVQAWGEKVQVLCQAQAWQGKMPFDQLHQLLRRGDVIGIVGYPGKTNPKTRKEGVSDEEHGELSIFATDVLLLAPCLHLLPSHAGLKDPETRFRKRYLDFIVNEETHRIMRVRDQMDAYICNYFRSNNFVKVQTPMMNSIAGGATAKPFKTFHNDLNKHMFMRVAPELFLKEMIVGGFERVFEIGRQFRNEDIDLTHNPEFTTCEFYEAFADDEDVMNRTEELVAGLVEHITGGLKTKYHTQHGEVYDVDWSRPWRRVDMIPALEQATGEKFPAADQLHTAETTEFLKKVLKKMNVECPPPMTPARMLDKLVGEFIEETCINPTFIRGHPQVMSPLAKYHREISGITERFEAFVCKKEIVNAYTELNDPFDQRLRFEEQARQKDQGDDEAQLIDEDFLEAMEFGLPPTGGFGMGIDRLVMFLTDNYSIKEVLAFPMMRDVVNTSVRAAEVVGVEPKPEEGIAHK